VVAACFSPDLAASSIAGVRNFIRTWSESRDHAALEDFVAAMRPYAADSTA